MIFVGYSCIGKSLAAMMHDSVVDLDSSYFMIDGKKPDNWVELYVSVADNLSKQGKTVLISSHKEVREYMNKNKISFTAIFPSLGNKEVWLERLRERYKLTNLEKDKRALERAEQHYESDIADLMNEKNKIVINGKNYLLEDFILGTKDREAVDTFNMFF